MKITYQQLEEKILGCFNGKNIGGALGAPFEGRRQINNVTTYVQENIYRNPPPNDDLDLQLIWLNAVERFGSTVDHEILAEYWLTYIYPNWSEYGTGKINLRKGILPPVSGRLENVYKDSCGSFIRSEIWACLAPGHPEIATTYAYLDACVDHADEGIYGEVFCSAVESAAFVETDIPALLAIGLSYIPKECAVAKGVRIVLDCYEKGMDWLAARKKLFTEVPGAFGIQTSFVEGLGDEFPVPPPGFDAPNNIGIAVLGLLYGEKDFGKTICTAVNCGEDTDCTAGFAAAVLGIIGGNSAIPEEWSAPIAGVINTCCINLSEWGFYLPPTVEALTHRLLAQIPRFLEPDFLCQPLVELSAEEIFSVSALEKEELFCPRYVKYMKHNWRNRGARYFEIGELMRLPMWCSFKAFPVFKAALICDGDPFVTEGGSREFTLKIWDNSMSRSQNWAEVRVIPSDGLVVEGGSAFSIPVQNTYRYCASQKFTVRMERTVRDADVTVLISLCGRHSLGMLTFKLISASQPREEDDFEL